MEQFEFLSLSRLAVVVVAVSSVPIDVRTCFHWCCSDSLSINANWKWLDHSMLKNENRQASNATWSLPDLDWKRFSIYWFNSKNSMYWWEFSFLVWILLNELLTSMYCIMCGFVSVVRVDGPILLNWLMGTELISPSDYLCRKKIFELFSKTFWYCFFLKSICWKEYEWLKKFVLLTSYF